jgi:hypothetical protein
MSSASGSQWLHPILFHIKWSHRPRVPALVSLARDRGHLGVATEVSGVY